MASLRRHPKSPSYFACFTGENGKRYQRSTGIRVDGTVTARRQAQKIADEFEDNQPNALKHAVDVAAKLTPLLPANLTN